MKSFSAKERMLLAVLLSACRPLLSAATPMTTSQVSSPQKSQPQAKPTSSFRRQFDGLLKRQEQTQTCATLDGYSSEWALPYACSGGAPQCTAVGPLLGCCDSGACTVYNTCYNAVDSASCTGSCTSTALVCGDTAPSCSEYHIVDKSTIGAWTGFSCGTSSITLPGSPASGLLVIQTQITSNGNFEASTSTLTSEVDTTTSVTSIITVLTLFSSTAKPDPPSTETSTSPTLHPPPTGPSSTSSVTAGATPSAGNGTAAASSSISKNHTEIGAITGGTVAGVLLLAAVLFYLVRRQNKRRRERNPVKELGQPPYGEMNQAY